MFNKKTLLTLVFISSLALSLPAFSATAQRIAVLDLQEAMMSTDKISRAFEEIDRQLSSEESRIRQLAEEGRSLQQRLQRDGDVMSESERTRLTQEMQQKVQEYQQRGNQLQQRQQQMRQQVVNDNRPQLERVVNELLEEHNIDILLDRQAVHFAKPQFDLTPVVADKLNELE
ncbi:OmpH family outer membrane protein [Marinospirillum celere]|uniref:OmpH family outer membrane protein n=1 Tax=Marinospirillum celere TaxID=1122252 RepID=UPI0015A51F32|nr:OmpH family outer membrane protein [Marinospirillum celere]